MMVDGCVWGGVWGAVDVYDFTLSSFLFISLFLGGPYLAYLKQIPTEVDYKDGFKKNPFVLNIFIFINI